MANKTCGECKNLTNRKTIGFCQKMKYALCPAELPSCANFEQKVISNGDVIRQMSNKKLATCIEELAFRFSHRREFVAWLNAPTESEAKDE
jgi:hypothetical protein